MISAKLMTLSIKAYSIGLNETEKAEVIERGSWQIQK